MPGRPSARPTAPGKFPGVVLIHHMPGWDEWTMETACKLAHHGYVAISPNFHYREGKDTPETNSASTRDKGGMPDDRTMGDVEGAITAALHRNVRSSLQEAGFTATVPLAADCSQRW